jgi:hypothetical protein
MNQVIDHNQTKLSPALGLKEEFIEEVRKIVTAHFVTEAEGEAPKRGHEKASISITEAIALAKKKVFNDEGPVQEYEATLAYLAYIVGCEITAAKERQMNHRRSLAEMIFGADPLEEKKGKAIIMKVDSEEEAKLHQSVIENMAKGNFAKAMGSLIMLKDIKEGKPKKKGSKTTRKTSPKK